MASDSHTVKEVGDAPNITRLLDEKINCKTFLSSWSSPEKFAAHVQDGSEADCWYNGSVYRDGDADFSGVSTVAEAVDLCFNGWAEGGALIEKTRGYVRALNPLSPKMVKYGVAGTTPNVPRAIAGNILNMRLPDRVVSKKKKTITLVYNMCESGGQSKDAISNKAAVTAALIDEIEAKGFSCEVIACAMTSNYNSFKALTSVCVKESHQPVDVNRLAFSLGHSAMFRVMFFADWQKDDFCEPLGYGLGCVDSTRPSKELNEKQIYTITSGWRKNKIPINLFSDLDKSATEGLNAIVSELQRQGCPAFPKKDHEDDLEQSEEDTPEPYDDFDHSSY